MPHWPSEDGSRQTSLESYNDTDVLRPPADEERRLGLIAVQRIQLWRQLPQQVPRWERSTWQSKHPVILPTAVEHITKAQHCHLVVSRHRDIFSTLTYIPEYLNDTPLVSYHQLVICTYLCNICYYLHFIYTVYRECSLSLSLYLLHLIIDT